MTNQVIQVSGDPIGGVLPAGGVQVVGLTNQMHIPATMTLSSSAGGRLIELSSDGGVNYFTPTYDATTTNMINVGIFAPLSHVRFTGTAGDAWSVR